MSDTPETDYFENNLGKAAEMSHPALWTFARKLERERDEALRLLCDIKLRWIGSVPDDGCDCLDCEFLRAIDVILTKYTN